VIARVELGCRGISRAVFQAVPVAESGALPVALAVSGTVNVPVPTILASTTGLAFNARVNTVSGVQSYTVSGMDLSVQTAAPVAGVVAPTTIYVRYAPQVVGADTGDIVHDSTGANTVTILLTGTATAPPVQPPVQPPQDTPVSKPDNPACTAHSSAGWASLALLAAIVGLQLRRRRVV
jgi:hypothetical protein